MCGRYTHNPRDRKFIAQLFGLDEGDIPLFEPRYNIAPSQYVPAVVMDEAHHRRLVSLKWGLVPHWADDPKIGYKMINARCETVGKSPAFRGAFRHHRCLVIADGFYEWKGVAKKKQPYYFQTADQQPFAFAGLWDHWERGAEPIDSCTIITTEANETVRPVHDRMPVMLHPEDYARWLDPTIRDPQELQPLLKPFPDDEIMSYLVSTRVNSPKNDGPQNIEKISDL